MLEVHRVALGADRTALASHHAVLSKQLHRAGRHLPAARHALIAVRTKPDPELRDWGRVLLSLTPTRIAR